METSINAINVTNIADCVVELVSNSLHVNATSIAIRFHSEERKIQVIDNGIGIPKVELKTIAEYNNKNYCNYPIGYGIHNWKKQTLINIRRLSNAMMITSRCYNSSKTYMKIFKIYQKSNIVRIERRPSQGTTITIYGFHELSLSKWNITFMYYLIENIAIANPQTSFTIRDDKIKKITMIITKPHNPINIFKFLYNKKVIFHKVWFIKSIQKSDIKFCAYIGISNSNFTASQHIFINNKLVHCPLILQIISTIFINTLKFFKKQITEKETIFILLFIICTEYIFIIENGKRTLMLSNIYNLLQSIKNKIINIFIKDIKPLSVNDLKCSNKANKQKSKNNEIQLITDHLMQVHVSAMQNINTKNIQLTLSEWSNWSDSKNLKQCENNSLRFYKHFDFLPEKLHKLLRKDTKLIQTNILNAYNENLYSIKIKSGLQSKLNFLKLFFQL
ncbi:uncharacterized protein LOC105736858 [Apis florea]|uniref:uncharacterized protein LOC105736858 n=1 Tax=Apis florea TaxID=7463 RepID=UPI0006290A41|nr:uncharacterized protein LOC105736858 [Apis florea]XP_031775694.1 uncharacterized protein LOC105736858 [Apis florea]